MGRIDGEGGTSGASKESSASSICDHLFLGLDTWVVLGLRLGVSGGNSSWCCLEEGRWNPLLGLV